jgi:HlyD family secretion protein
VKRVVPRLVALLSVLIAAPVAAEWSRIVPADRPITVSASGMVSSADALRFGPPPSRDWRLAITNIAREGTMVSEGDMLAQFDGSAADDRVRTLGADLNNKRSELDSLLETQANEVEEDKVRIEAARSAADKAARKADVEASVYASLEYRKLLEERDIALKLHEKEIARGALVARVRKAQRRELEAEIRRLESELEGARQELASFTIRAPRAGMVIVGMDRNGQKLDVNDSVNPGMVIVELANPDTLIVQAEVPEYAATRIAVGQAAEVVIDAAGGTTFNGEVVSVASIVRRQSQYSQAMVRDVTVSLPKAAMDSLRPGMSARVTVVVDTARSALAVPDEALQYRDGKPGVVVRGGGWRPVVLGRASAGLYIVASGLEAGAEVALR